MIDVTDMVRHPAIFRATDINSVDRGRLFEEVLSGAIIQHGRGLYSSTRANISDAEALLFHVPHAIATLDTALWFHRLIDRPPDPIWISIDAKARCPRLAPLKIEALRCSVPPPPEDLGDVQATPRGPRVRAFRLPRIAIDFVRARNRIGIEHAYARLDLIIPQVDRAELMACADRCGVGYPLRRFLARR